MHSAELRSPLDRVAIGGRASGKHGLSPIGEGHREYVSITNRLDISTHYYFIVFFSLSKLFKADIKFLNSILFLHIPFGTFRNLLMFSEWAFLNYNLYFFFHIFDSFHT